MIYLHKSVFQSHGYLSSANCHVDSRWVLKIAGFALHAFRKDANPEQVNEHFFAVSLSLHLHIYLSIKISAKSDNPSIQKRRMSRTAKFHKQRPFKKKRNGNNKTLFIS